MWCGNNELDQGYNWSYHKGSTWGEWDKTLVDHGLFLDLSPTVVVGGAAGVRVL